MTATMAMSAEKRAGICRSLARNVGCSVNGSIKALARIIKLARVMRIHLRLIQTRKSPSSNEDSAWQCHSRNHMTKIVEKQGSLFRLSDAAYRRLLELVIAEQEYDLWELGRFQSGPRLPSRRAEDSTTLVRTGCGGCRPAYATCEIRQRHAARRGPHGDS